MLAELINRRDVKAEVRRTLREAQVSPKAFTALYFALLLVMNLVDSLTGEGLMASFVMILVSLLSVVLDAGYRLYGMAVRRGERAEYLCLFDGFSFAGKIIALTLLESLFVFLWSMLFTIPGIVALYRYRFAILNLCENPELSPREALNMSKRQTMGYKSQLFDLDVSCLGWTILANIPLFIYNALVSWEIMAESWAYYGMDFSLPSIDVTAILPLWGWSLLMGSWLLVVSMFYRPVYMCAELSYFETAKRTSGIGYSRAPVTLPQEENGETEDEEPQDPVNPYDF